LAGEASIQATRNHPRPEHAISWVLQVAPAIAQCQLNAKALPADFHDIADYLEEPAPTEPENNPDNEPDDQNEIDPDNPLPQD